MANRLKSLELQGYKTFASRNEFRFPHAITAIVGPNGSGKSNVADAIRWVLGEQSFSLLRARKTEDMIFSGSDQRSRAGMATATITFDNEDGWLPLDFNEVSITRHAYRDGQNEYLINNQRVRLKEVYELLSQSGLAQRTYTVIGQGLVDAALSLKPDERRKFFEEAAGISLYRDRRQEAQDRLVATRRNLERVSDILGELGPRLHSLERQSKKVVDFQRVQEDLKVLMKDWYGYHWHKSQEEFNVARAASQNQDDRLMVTRAEYEEAERALTGQRGKLNELRETLNQYLAETARLNHEREQYLRQVAVLEERERMLADQRQHLESDLVAMKDDRQLQTERIELILKEQQQLQAELNDAGSHLNDEQQKLADFRTKKDAYETRLAEARNQRNQLDSRKTRLETQLAELERRQGQLTNSRQNYEQNFQQITQASAGLTERSQQLEAVLTDLRARVNEAHEAVKNSRESISDLQAKGNAAQVKLRDHEAKITRLSTQTTLLQQAEASHSGLNEGARQLLKVMSDNGAKGGLQAISQQMNVQAGYEAAIAAALGEFVDALVVPENTAIENALDNLRSRDDGRVILLPKDLKSEPGSAKNAVNGDTVKFALDVITPKSGFESIFRVILEKFVITESRQDARRVAAQLAPNQAAVTLDGEVFWGSGVIKGGRENRGGVIARQRELKDLLQQLDEAKLTEKVLRDEYTRLNTQKEEQTAAEAELIAKERTLQTELQNAERQHQQLQLQTNQSEQKANLIREQLGGIEQQMAQAAEEAQSRVKELDETIAALQTAETELKQLTHEDFHSGLDELQLQVNHWLTQVTVLNHAKAQAEQRHADHEQGLQRLDANAQSAEKRLENLSAEIGTLNAEQKAAQTASDELGEQLSGSQEKLVPVETDLKTEEAAYDHQQTTLSELQQRLTLAERLSAQTQMEVTRKKEAMENLQKRIEDDFGLVTLEYATDVSGPKPLPFEGMVQQLAPLEMIAPEVEEAISRNKSLLRRMGAINPEAHKEYSEVKERFDYLTAQVADLKKADEDLMTVIAELNEIMKQKFSKTFTQVAAEFKVMFTQLFGGGSAKLVLTDEENPSDAGIEIEAKLPGRREQGLALLSGGERSLTAVALIFALLKVSPTPFCVLDEVDAALDEANVGRFGELLKTLSEKTQFIIITHNRNTVEISGVIYGVTMGKDSTSQVVSLLLDEVSEEMVGARK